jgi:hypothetical protein
MSVRYLAAPAAACEMWRGIQGDGSSRWPRRSRSARWCSARAYLDDRTFGEQVANLEPHSPIQRGWYRDVGQIRSSDLRCPKKASLGQGKGQRGSRATAHGRAGRPLVTSKPLGVSRLSTGAGCSLTHRYDGRDRFPEISSQAVAGQGTDDQVHVSVGAQRRLKVQPGCRHGGHVHPGDGCPAGAAACPRHPIGRSTGRAVSQ